MVPGDRRAVVVVPRPVVVAGPPDVVDGSLDVLVSATDVVVDDDDVGAWTTISLGLPTELPSPAMPMPSATQMRRRRTMPARWAAGPCQSMAEETTEDDFFCGGSINVPTGTARSGPNSNGPVTPYELGSRASRGRSNTVPTRLETG